MLGGDRPGDVAGYWDAATTPMPAPDGVTIFVPLRGRTEDGVYHDGPAKIVTRGRAVEWISGPERPASCA